MSGKFSVIIEKDSSGYYVYCPELKGCHSQGDSFEEAYENIKEAIELYLETFPEEHPKLVKTLLDNSGKGITTP